MSDWKNLYSEVKKRKMEALNKKDVVKAVEKHGRILAIEGEYEKPQKIIEHMYAAEKIVIKRKMITKKIRSIDFNDFDVLLIGCSGKDIPTSVFSKIRDFVLNGNYLITTDWALQSIIEPIFPGYIRWNRQRTADAVVPCQILETNHPFVEGVLGEIQQSKYKSNDTKNDEFKWWLETRSFPIEVLNYNEVKILINSWEIKKKWGEGAVLVYFNYGKKGGKVIHMISHTHLQKGGIKGKYASAMILTNILDEKISNKLGIQQKNQGYVSSWEEIPRPIQNQKPLEEQWVTPQSNNNYLNPSSINQDSNVSLTTTSQIVEIDKNSSDFSFGSKCVYCGYDFLEYTNKIYKCKECGIPYHEQCINQQVNEGICKNCQRILLW